MPSRGEAPLDLGQLGQLGVQAQMPPSLLQMAQGEPSASDQNSWVPQWVYDQLPANLAYFNASGGGGRDGGGDGGLNPFAAPGSASAPGQLAPWYNPENWGPPPKAVQPAPGFFPSEFRHGGSDPTGKFWSQQAYQSQFPGGGGSIDQRPNTLNWRLLGNEPGNFMFAGHPISQAKLYYDLHRPIDTQEGAGVPGGSIMYNKQFGPEFSAWSTKGQLGLPGQLDPFAQMWGSGGP